MQDAGREPERGAPRGTARATGSAPDPRRLLRRQEDRRRYLRILAPDPAADPQGPGPQPAAGVARSAHPLLGAPASTARTATHFPDPEHVRRYLAHSCDLTMRGGTAAALVYPLAACALAEHYVLRRVAGSSAAGAAAAAVAAAELGRGAPDPEPRPAGLAVAPGYAGLAGAMRWLTGSEAGGEGRSPEHHRLARLLQPAPATRAAYRLLAAGLRREAVPRRPAAVAALAGATLALAGRGARAVAVLLWLGALVGWGGLLVALVRTRAMPVWITVLLAPVLLLTFALAAAAASAIACAAGLPGRLRRRAEAHGFGLVPGVPPPSAPGSSAGTARAGGTTTRTPAGTVRRWTSAWADGLDRRLGLPAAGVPPLMTWLADRIDDLAGVPRAQLAGGSGTGGAASTAHPVRGGPPRRDGERDRQRDREQQGQDGGHGGQDRYALTFGDLWLGRIGPRSAEDLDLLRRAASDSALRVVDLRLTTVNVSRGRPYTLPFAPTAAATGRADGGDDRAGGPDAWLFCHACLVAALPERVVEQMILLSPAAATESTCPRHPGEALTEVPDPWDFPVAAAVRMSIATPGVLQAVPLQTIEATGASAAARTHWFCDGAGTAEASVQHFDALLPRWPTFALAVEDPPGGASAGQARVALPEQDGQPRPGLWRDLRDPRAFAAALAGTAGSWRDRAEADLPGLRGRIATVARAGATAGTGTRPAGPGVFLDQDGILQLAVQGHAAGTALRRRFTGPDGDVAGQTQTDRYRWIRLRVALQAYRRLSLDIGARLPLYGDLAAEYRVPASLAAWFDPPPPPGDLDPMWPEAAAAVTHVRALSAGGVLDWDTANGAPPVELDLRAEPRW